VAPGNFKKTESGFCYKVIVSEKVQETSFFVTELIARKRKSHVVGENLIMPAGTRCSMRN
jgi:hypothetical protein